MARYLRASGNWNGPVWAATSNGVAGSAATPTASDDVYIAANFTVTLTADAVCLSLSHTNGTLSLSSFTLELSSAKDHPLGFYSGGASARTINMGSGTLIIRKAQWGRAPFSLLGSNLTFNADTSLIIFETRMGSRPTAWAQDVFNSGSKTFNDVQIRIGVGGTQPTDLDITGSPTFRSIIIQSKNSEAHTVKFDSGATVKADKFVAVGSSTANRLNLGGGVASFIQIQPGGSTYGQFVNVDGLSATGDIGVPHYIGSNSIDTYSVGSRAWLLQDPPKATTLLDKFDTGSTPGGLWNVSKYNSGFATISGGMLSMGWTGGADSLVVLMSTDTYDFVDNETYVQVASASGEILSLGIPQLKLWAYIPNTATEVYYRLRGVSSGGNTTVYIESNASGGWTTLTSGTFDTALVRSNRLEISGTRNLGSAVLNIDSVGVSPGASISGSLILSGGASRRLIARRGVSGTMTLSGGAFNQGTHNRIITGTMTLSGGAIGYKIAMRSISGTMTLSGGASRLVMAQRAISGSLLLSGGASKFMQRHNRQVSGSLMLSGSVRAVVLRDAEALQGKRYLYKVYDEDGTYIETWGDVISELSYTNEINTLGSTTNVELARNSDSLGVVSSPLKTEAGVDILTEANQSLMASVESKNQIGPGSSVQYNNRVDVLAYYGSVSPILTEGSEIITTEAGEELLASIGSPNGRRVFTGFISEINSRYGNTESTMVQLSSYGWDLDQFPLTGSSGATTVTYNSYDPSNIVKDAIDKFKVAGASYGVYTDRGALTIADTGTTISYTFRSNTYAEVLSKTLELMPSNWYYRIGLGDNLVYYNARSETPDHLLYLGKHIKALDLKGSILDVTNRVLFTGGGDPALYIDRSDTPEPRTRRSLKVLSDNRVTLLSSAEVIAQGAIDAQKQTQYRSTVEVLADVYDIETINNGDVIGFRNFGNYVDELLMQVVGISYTPDSVQLQLDTKPPTINKRLEDISRNLKVTENQNLPTTPS